MKFGIHSLLFNETFTMKDLPVLDKCAKMGCEVVDIVPFDVDQFPAREVRKRAADLGLTIAMGFGLPETHNLISPDPVVRQKGIDLNKKMVDLCTEAGAVVYGGVIHCGWGYTTGKRRTADEWNWSLEAFAMVAEYANRVNPDLILAIEPVNRFESHFINTIEDALEFINDIKMPNVKVHADTFHMIREENDIASAIISAGDKLGYIHACESHRGIPGRGMVPWLDFFTALKHINYDGCVTIESFDPNMPSIAKLCCMWRDYADSPEALTKEGLAYLRNTYNEIG